MATATEAIDLNRLAAAVEAKIMARGGRQRGDEITFQCPTPEHADEHPSCRYHRIKMAYICDSCGASGGLMTGNQPLAPLLDLDAAEYRDNGPRRAEARTVSWKIRDVKSQVVAEHHRRDLPDGGKRIWWTRDGKLGLGGRKPADLPLYGCHLLEDSEPGDDTPVFVVEGEKAADALLALGLPAVGTVTGAASIPGAMALEVLRNRAVVLWSDADDAGRRHMRRIAEALENVAASVRVFAPGGLPEGGDAVEWVQARPTAESDEIVQELLTLVEAEAVLPEPRPLSPAETIEAWLQTESSDRAHVRDVIPALAQLEPLDYDQTRDQVAKAAGVRVVTLDAEVNAARGNDGPVKDSRGTALVLADPEPWREPVGGNELLGDLAQSFRTFLALPEGGATALALWVIFAHAHDAFEFSVLLAITSPEKRCGKTTLLAILNRLVPRPLSASNITPASLFRAVEAFQPTLIIDEADTFLREREELKGVLNSGHARVGAFVIRCDGDAHEVRLFSTWCPKAIALIGRLPDTLQDRSIVVPMRRRAPGEAIERLRLDRLDVEDLRRKAARWANEHLEELRDADPDVPDGLNDRAADNWRLLLAIADLAGGDWPETARNAAILLAGTRGSDDGSVRTLLLADLRQLFNDRPADCLSSAVIVEALIEMEERPWPEWRQGNPLTARALARLLAPFEVRPEQLWIGGAKRRGYDRDDFEDTWKRYLQDADEALPSTETPLVTGRTGRTRVSSAFQPNREAVNEDNPTASETAEDPGQQGVLPVLPVEDPGAEHNEAEPAPALAEVDL